VGAVQEFDGMDMVTCLLFKRHHILKSSTGIPAQPVLHEFQQIGRAAAPACFSFLPSEIFLSS